MIRLAVLSDAAAIATIHVQTWQSAYQDLLPAGFLAGLSISKRTEYWSAELQQTRSRVLVFEKDSQLLGWISAGPGRDPDATDTQEVYALYVKPEEQRAGIGTQLLRAVENDLPASVDLTLWVLAENREALAFYQARDYARDGLRRETTIGGSVVTEMRLRKSRIQVP
ncbi:MAG TPA: GNAT family N-acetyltransferase [Opitutaceae bacterium]|nr:GNAT family N-acetyltransferase [Opitutaceae bacterium]